MQLPSVLRTAALVVATAAPAAGFAASDTFLNGQSIYGQPAAAPSSARVVDIAKTPSTNVAYGETVVFRGDAGQQFAWTFNGLDRRSVELAKIAPTGFGGKSAFVFIGRNPSNRR